LQLTGYVTAAHKDELRPEIVGLWEDNAVSDSDRARAVFWARDIAYTNLGTWFFQSPRFPMQEVLEVIARRQMGPGFDKFLFGWEKVNADMVTAAIQMRVPLLEGEDKLLLNLLKVGGVALAELALSHGYRLSFPPHTDCLFPFFEYVPHINLAFIDWAEELVSTHA
jgi:hypothetical protein